MARKLEREYDGGLLLDAEKRNTTKRQKAT